MYTGFQYVAISASSASREWSFARSTTVQSVGWKPRLEPPIDVSPAISRFLGRVERKERGRGSWSAQVAEVDAPFGLDVGDLLAGERLEGRDAALARREVDDVRLQAVAAHPARHE